jgi:hypothetical protein
MKLNQNKEPIMATKKKDTILGCVVKLGVRCGKIFKSLWNIVVLAWHLVALLHGVVFLIVTIIAVPTNWLLDWCAKQPDLPLKKGTVSKVKVKAL